MAVKGRNKPRTGKPKKMVRKKKTARTVGSEVKRLAPKIIGSMMGPAGLGSSAILGMAPPRDRRKDPADSTSTSPRPKPRPKTTSVRPKSRPKTTSVRPKARPSTAVERGNRIAKMEAKEGVGLRKKAKGGSLKEVPEGNKGLKKLPTAVRNKMGYMQKGGSCRGMGKATRGGSYGRMG